MSAATWPQVRSRFVFLRRDVRGADAPLASATKGGVLLRDDLEISVWNPESDVSNYKLVERDDFVIGLRSFQHGISHSEVRGIVSPAYTVLRGTEAVSPRFFKHYFRSAIFVSQLANLTQGIRQGQTIDIEAFANLEIPAPPLDEQRRIADFLDAETARIDALMASRRAQISRLNELELARIGEHLFIAETLGPVYAYFDVQLGKMLNAERASGDSQQPYLRNANVHWYEIDTEDMATMTFEPDERLRYGVQAGDLLVCEGGAGVAEAAVWDGRISTCFYQKSLHRVRARSYVPVEWLMYWMRYAKAIGIFDADGNVATIPHLTGEQLAEHRIPIPEDGHRRVAELSSEIAAIRETQRKMASADALLAERRQALITAAVSGQLDVTTARGVAV